MYNTCGVTITQWSVQTHISQLATPNVLLLGSNIGEYYFTILQSHLLGCYVYICLTNLNIIS